MPSGMLMMCSARAEFRYPGQGCQPVVLSVLLFSSYIQPEILACYQWATT
jgi:hypothetical protein